MSVAIATGLAAAATATPELAGAAVRVALERAGGGIARSVLLFLSPEFAHCAHAAVLAASRAANCLQVVGCTAAGVFTEEDGALDRPAAAVMAFAGECELAAHDESGAPRLSLALPQGASDAWLGRGAPRYGLISTDASAHAPGRLWCHGKTIADGCCDTVVTGARAAIGVSRGMRILGKPRAAVCRDRELLKLGDHAALDTLLRELPPELRDEEKLPAHLLAAGIISGSSSKAVEAGDYALVPVIAASREERSVSLAQPLAPGDRAFWALRQGLAAENEMRRLADGLAGQLGGPADFGLLFSCLGRGPWFFGGEDRDLAVVKERFPGMPLLGAYGGGQIAPFGNGNRQVHNAAVLALFAADV